MITSLTMQTVDVLAQVNVDIQPKPPAGSNGILEILRILLWCVIIGGIAAITVGGGWLAWEKFNGGVNNAPKVIVGALIGGIVATVAGGLMNMVVSAALQG